MSFIPEDICQCGRGTYRYVNRLKRWVCDLCFNLLVAIEADKRRAEMEAKYPKHKRTATQDYYMNPRNTK